MRIGATIFCQNYADWERFEAESENADQKLNPAPLHLASA